MAELDKLKEQWIYLYSEYLPSLATARDAVQPKWPVSLDHCFARIILDVALGGDTPWMNVVRKPAIKNMTAAQFTAAIELAEQIARGNVSLVELNERSLEMRNKKRKSADTAQPVLKKAKVENPVISSYFAPVAETQKNGHVVSKSDSDGREDMSVQLKRIADSDITVFRKQTLTLLCQIPRGRFSTYQAMSDYITRTSHKTCARAVGNAMRNNPFAPEVPCHRVLASDGSLGGFKGHWGEEGKFAGEKHRLLSEEGVKFDSQARVKGRPFREFGG